MNTNKATKIALKSSLAGSAKDILMSIIGTTISIALTFGTSSLIDHYQEKKARKLFAMTIIHEIDQDIEQVRKYAKGELELWQLNRYFWQNNYQFDKYPKDSLVMFYNLLDPDNEFPEFVKSNEQIFNSTQTTWSTIDNNIFLSNIQNYYKLRSKLESRIKEDSCFSPYLTYAQYRRKDTIINGLIVSEDISKTIKRLYQPPSIVVKMVSQPYKRLMAYNQLLQYQSINEENKILMGISDKDLEEFALRTADARNVSESDMVGSWIGKTYTLFPSSVNDAQNVFTFNKDNTLIVHGNKKMGKIQGSAMGSIIVYYSITGDWKIQNDSLVMTFSDDKLEMRIDDNDFYYTNMTDWNENKQYLENDEKRDVIISIRSDLGTDFAPNGLNTITVSAHIDRLNRGITLRCSKDSNPKRLERTDPTSIKTYDFVKHPATEQEITGKWAWFADAYTIQMEFDNKADHTFTIKKIDKVQHPDLFNGTMVVQRTFSGEWKIEDDLLVYYIDNKTFEISIDDSNITTTTGKENMVNDFKKEVADFFTQHTLQTPRITYKAITNAKRMEMIDKDGNMMFLYK